jgi:uncharacterized protein YndB with AHSA1/START domain
VPTWTCGSGGTWRYVMKATSGFEVALHGQYLEIVSNERIVATETFEGKPEAEAVSTSTVTETDGRTTLMVLLSHTSQQQGDAPINSDWKPACK